MLPRLLAGHALTCWASNRDRGRHAESPFAPSRKVQIDMSISNILLFSICYLMKSDLYFFSLPNLAGLGSNEYLSTRKSPVPTAVPQIHRNLVAG